MNDNELKDLIKKDAEDLKIPDRISPENIEAELNKKKVTSFAKYRKYVPVAAAILVVLMIPIVIANTKMGRSKNDMTGSADSAMIEEAATESAEADYSASFDSESVATGEREVFSGLFYHPKDEKEIEKYIKDLSKKRVSYETETAVEESKRESSADYVEEATAPEMNSADTATSGAGKGSDSEVHSETNTREKGIDEEDIIKTDGKYIYILKNDGRIKIVDIRSKEPVIASEIKSAEYQKSFGEEYGIYIEDDTLMVLYNFRDNNFNYKNNNTDTILWGEQNGKTGVAFFDIKDRTAPKLITTVTQTGSWQSFSRLKDGILYIFSQDRAGNLPYVCDDVIVPEDVYLSRGDEYYDGCFIITSVDIKNPKKVIDQKSIYACINDIYVSQNSIYLERSGYDGSEGEYTDLFKFEYENGHITPIETAAVPGSIDSSFSIDESSDGTLRVAVSTFGSKRSNYRRDNAVYTYDRNMNLLGELHDIASDEEIKSTRFIGDMLYLVTFRNTDPVFSIDLSDPSDPKLLGELKIPGFSDYLHPWSKDKLLGIGYTADEQTGQVTGLKLSMFDISDPANVKEEDVSEWKNDGTTYLPGMDNYKAILVDPEKNIIGFSIENNVYYYQRTGDDRFDDRQGYGIFSYEKDRFELHYVIGLDSAWSARGIFVGDNLYILDNDKLVKYDMSAGENADKAVAEINL